MSSSTADHVRAKFYRILDELTPQNLGIAFSGGIDSTLLAKVCSDLGKRVTLCTIGFTSRRDIEIAQRVAAVLALPLSHNEISIDKLEVSVKRVASLINFTRLTRLELSICFYHVFELAATQSLQTVLSANGLDELFCGYHAYRHLFLRGEPAIIDLMQRLVVTSRADKAEVDKLAVMLDIDYRCPFLSAGFVNYAMTIPLKLKIKGEDDTMRKHVLRTVARAVGIPDATAYRPKKAFQYSSGVHRALRLLAMKRGYTRMNAMQNGYSNATEAYIAHLMGRND